MNKIIKGISLIMIIGILATGCSNDSKQTNEAEDVPLEKIYEEIKEKVDTDTDGNIGGYLQIDLLEEDGVDPSADIYQETLQLDDNNIKNGFVLAAMMNVNADEIILLEASDENKVDELLKMLEQQLENQIQVWETYLPDQYEKVKNNIIKTNGNYLLYVTYENPEEIEAIFDSYFD